MPQLTNPTQNNLLCSKNFRTNIVEDGFGFHKVLVSACKSPCIPISLLTEELQAMMATTTFGMAGGCEDIACEKDQQACLRLTVKGARCVVMLPTIAAMDFFQQRKELGSHFKLKEVYQCMLTINKETFQELSKLTTVFHGAVQAYDCLYIPAGMMMLERVPDAEVFGYRAALACGDVDVLGELCKVMKGANIELPILGLNSAAATASCQTIADAGADAMALGGALAAPNLIKKAPSEELPTVVATDPGSHEATKPEEPSEIPKPLSQIPDDQLQAAAAGLASAEAAPGGGAAAGEDAVGAAAASVGEAIAGGGGGAGEGAVDVTNADDAAKAADAVKAQAPAALALAEDENDEKAGQKLQPSTTAAAATVAQKKALQPAPKRTSSAAQAAAMTQKLKFGAGARGSE